MERSKIVSYEEIDHVNVVAIKSQKTAEGTKATSLFLLCGIILFYAMSYLLGYKMEYIN